MSTTRFNLARISFNGKLTFQRYLYHEIADAPF